MPIKSKEEILFIYGLSNKIVKYCHDCGYSLTLGTETYCKGCGVKLSTIPKEQKESISNSSNITNTSRDIIDTGFTGIGHITGKEIGYRLQGDVIYLQFSGDVSDQVLEKLQQLLFIPTQLEHQSIGISINTEDLQAKVKESSKTHEQIKTVLEEVNEIEKKSSIKIKEIKVGDQQISKSELSLKEIILKGNEHYYKYENDESI